MKTAIAMILVYVATHGTSFAADYCASDEAGKAVGCSLMVRSGDPMQPLLAFVGKPDTGALVWTVSVRILLKEYVNLEGDSKIQVDSGELQDLPIAVSHQAEVKRDLLSESAVYTLSEGLLQEIAESSNGIRLFLSTAGSSPIEIAVSSDRYAELGSMIAEAKAKL